LPGTWQLSIRLRAKKDPCFGMQVHIPILTA